ncbi:unnamed protein product [Rhizophagus irregularis]|nr:unnamed protein product [Rhizophagus irregularis]
MGNETLTLIAFPFFCRFRNIWYWTRVPERFGSWEFGNSDDIYIYNTNLNQWEYQNAGVDLFAGFSIFYQQRRNFRTLKARPGLQTRGTRCSLG